LCCVRLFDDAAPFAALERDADEINLTVKPGEKREEIRGSSEKTKKGGNGPLLCLLQKQNERVVSNGVSKRDGLMI
jgi:hypothetical protein